MPAVEHTCGQCCQIGPDFPPNLATLAAACCLAAGCQIGREIWPNLVTLPVALHSSQKSLLGQITCRLVSMETSVSPEKGLRLGPGGQPLIDWSLECKTNDDTPEPD
ncbi:unnamed protein product [Boreogadus saida]